MLDENFDNSSQNYQNFLQSHEPQFRSGSSERKVMRVIFLGLGSI